MGITSGIDPSLHPISQVWMTGGVPASEQQDLSLHVKGERQDKHLKPNPYAAGRLLCLLR